MKEIERVDILGETPSGFVRKVASIEPASSDSYAYWRIWVESDLNNDDEEAIISYPNRSAGSLVIDLTKLPKEMTKLIIEV